MSYIVDMMILRVLRALSSAIERFSEIVDRAGKATLNRLYEREAEEHYAQEAIKMTDVETRT